MKLLSTFLIPATGLLLLAGSATAQRPRDYKAEDYRRYFKKPENAAEFWEAIKFNLEIGRSDLAAEDLSKLLALKPSDDDLYALQEKDGLAKFLRLQLQPTWFDAPDTE